MMGMNVGGMGNAMMYGNPPPQSGPPTFIRKQSDMD
jgi:hypothetical protein